MRIDAVNSYLSARPVVWQPPVAPVMRDGEQIHLPENKPIAQKRPPFAYDTYGRSEPRVSLQVPIVQISEREVSSILDLINSQKNRTDVVKMWFPALLRV